MCHGALGGPTTCPPGCRKARRAFEVGLAPSKWFLQAAGLGSPGAPQLSHSPLLALT